MRVAAAIAIACLIVGIAVSPAVSAAPTRNHGYWIAGQNSQVFAFGDAQLYPQRGDLTIRGQVADVAAHPGGRGYWLLGRDGGVYPYGDARDYGQGAVREQNATAIASTPTGAGYFIATEFGEVKTFGDAVTHGSLSNKDTKRRIVDMAVTPSGGGYWLVDVTGQVYVFGDAVSFGSASASDVVAIAATPRGDGYWIATSGGDVYAFGAAPRRAPMTDRSKRIVDMTPTTSGGGYWLIDRDGLVFAFGDAISFGQLAPRDLRSGQIVAIVSTPFVNHDPVANADTATFDEDTAVDLAVLANDTDEDGDPLSAAVLTQPAHGTATKNGDGTIHYAPAKDYNGEDAFTYVVTDGVGGSATGQVRLVILPVNDAPVANDDTFITDEDTQLVGSLVTNDTDVDGDALTGQLVSGPAHGTLALGPGGSFTYLPDLNFNGDDGFLYRAFDGALASDTATVRIHVNPVNDPPASLEDGYSLLEDDTLTVDAPGVLANDSDVDSPVIVANLVTPTAHGDLTFRSDGSFAYVPAANYNGFDGFVYTASDGLLDSAPTLVVLFVQSVNDAPVGTADTYTTDEDTPLAVDVPGVLANDSDVDGDVLLVRLAEPAAHGDVVLRADGSFEYTPAPNYNGADGFTYDISDGTATALGITVTITINPVADPPKASDDAYAAQVGTTLTVVAPGVLANDFAESGPMTAILVTDVTHGTLSLNGDGSFTYTTALTAAGTDAFTYKVNDGTGDSAPATVQLTVSGTGGGGGSTGSFGGFGQGTLTVWDYDSLKIGGGTGTLKTKLGRVVQRTDGTYYLPDRGVRGHDSFTYGGRRYEIDILSDIWGD